jgi:hypothetical protein
VPPHDRGRPTDRGDGAEVVHLELAQQFLAPDLRHRSEPRGKPRGIEERIQTSELEHHPAEQGVEAFVVPHVHGDAYRAPRDPRRRLLRGGCGARGVEIGHDDVGALFSETQGRRLPDPAAPADHERDVPR